MNTHLMDLGDNLSSPGDRNCTKATYPNTRGGKENSSESGRSHLRGISPPKGVDSILFMRKDAVKIASDHKCFGTIIFTIMVRVSLAINFIGYVKWIWTKYAGIFKFSEAFFIKDGLALFLAVWTIKCRTLTQRDLFYGFFTSDTGFTFTVIHIELLFEVAAKSRPKHMNSWKLQGCRQRMPIAGHTSLAAGNGSGLRLLAPWLWTPS